MMNEKAGAGFGAPAHQAQAPLHQAWNRRTKMAPVRTFRLKVLR